MFCGNVHRVSDARCAEVVKVAEGVYRDVNISLANGLLRVCDSLGVDFWEMRAAANHQYCNIHEPGMVGGHCIPVYPWFLINSYDVPLIRLARRLNDRMVEYYADRALKLAGKRGKVGVIGLTYRAGIREHRHTQAHRLIKALRRRGLEVFGSDPLFTPGEVEELFKVKYFHSHEAVDAVILTDRFAVEGLVPEKTVDVKGVFRRRRIGI